MKVFSPPAGKPLELVQALDGTWRVAGPLVVKERPDFEVRDMVTVKFPDPGLASQYREPFVLRHVINFDE